MRPLLNLILMLWLAGLHWALAEQLLVGTFQYYGGLSGGNCSGAPGPEYFYVQPNQCANILGVASQQFNCAAPTAASYNVTSAQNVSFWIGNDTCGGPPGWTPPLGKCLEVIGAAIKGGCALVDSSSIATITFVNGSCAKPIEVLSAYTYAVNTCTPVANFSGPPPPTSFYVSYLAGSPNVTVSAFNSTNCSGPLVSHYYPYTLNTSQCYDVASLGGAIQVDIGFSAFVFPPLPSSAFLGREPLALTCAMLAAWVLVTETQ